MEFYDPIYTVHLETAMQSNICLVLTLVVQNQAHSSMETETQSSVCLVHSLAWMSTYQFVLNEIVNHDMMLGSSGHDFSKKICTCNDGQGNTSRFLFRQA